MTKRTVSFTSSLSQPGTFQSAVPNHFYVGTLGNIGNNKSLVPRMPSSAHFVLFWHHPGPMPLTPLFCPQSPASFFPEGQWTIRVETTELTVITAQKQNSKTLLRTGQGEEMRGTGPYCRLDMAGAWFPGVYGICTHITKANLFFFFLFALLGFALSELICNQGTPTELFSASCLPDSLCGTSLQRSYIL